MVPLPPPLPLVPRARASVLQPRTTGEPGAGGGQGLGEFLDPEALSQASTLPLWALAPPVTPAGFPSFSLLPHDLEATASLLKKELEQMENFYSDWRMITYPTTCSHGHCSHWQCLFISPSPPSTFSNLPCIPLTCRPLLPQQVWGAGEGLDALVLTTAASFPSSLVSCPNRDTTQGNHMQENRTEALRGPLEEMGRGEAQEDRGHVLQSQGRS
ncbi:hypothetical protein P7K49_035623 [Saguinus oedipus]|uniref:Uncharacterized protein n=1 Tax=Saguinus oedipus TaxID=9490 RepID=A0ABQ9TP36_SAGOE|nr:hypothetical protein P7K49_035623 [Saguinus oedipus]